MPIADFEAMKRKLEDSAPLGYQSYKPQYGADKHHPHDNLIKLFSWPPTGGELGKSVVIHYGLGPEMKGRAFCRKAIGAQQGIRAYQ